MKSILQEEKDCCFLCKRRDEPLDEHHIFAGGNRSLSERYGLKVYLCHSRCHIFGECAVHCNAEVDKVLKRYAQKKAMERYKWTVDDFISIFGKNYL